MFKKGLFCLIVLFLVTGLLGFASFADETYKEVSHWGSYGSGNGQFNMPRGVAVDSRYVYVVDSGNNRVQVFDRNGRYIRQWGRSGSGSGEFEGPMGIAVLNAWVYVVDRHNSRVQQFTRNGRYIRQWGGSPEEEKEWGSLGAKCGAGATGIAASSMGRVLVANANQVKRFTTKGRYIDNIGPGGVGAGVFIETYDVAFDGSWNIYVSDFGRNRIYKFDRTGAFLFHWGTTGSGKGELDGPAGLAVDRAGNVYVADHGNDRIQKFGPDGSFKAIIGHPGADTGGIMGPFWVAVDAAGDVYVPTAGPMVWDPTTRSWGSNPWIKKFKKVD